MRSTSVVRTRARAIFAALVLASALATGQSAQAGAVSASGLQTADEPSEGLSIAAYNVRKIYSTTDWGARRQPVADNILSIAPDVIGLSEATPKTWAGNGKKQFADLLALLGSPYALATSGSTSSGTQLAYNRDRLSVVSSGVKVLLKKGDARRYAVWAVFKDRLNGKSFFAITTHLEPGSQKSSTYNDVRIRQARQVRDLAKANSGGRPTVILGDMNSSRSAQPYNGQYKVFVGAGYIDPLDNAKASWAAGDNALAETMINAQYNSANHFYLTPPRTKFDVGTHIDYMYVSPGIRVETWRQVLSLDEAGNFVGTIPSDHNMMEMRVHLP
ncbi:endonuclease/exonuclease/phosphatase family metal-dependent hydrolase [Aeromicrobium panaciterrae]|uniref:Endonuclease/exonuclease/phosphatase family metal-dependent hydrolase n=1 Tax=Aeromicrobium panaciterrae TaxID=363861 RepID=A0ABU1UQM5_9ACTN|nr:endonuclease/exonuclease/phosphatase family protein [Aeromicrobium panaciterrae]MDR7087484.1 endonuclease/exonuclease/phosphatase family metal-dependent hydrolase [Aeromicrobium panaciterrae]